jgi:hypothetical protein
MNEFESIKEQGDSDSHSSFDDYDTYYSAIQKAKGRIYEEMES